VYLYARPNPTKTSTLNPRRIHEIYVDYVDEYLFTKYVHGFQVFSTWIFSTWM